MPLSVRLFRRVPGAQLTAVARATARYACRTTEASHAQALALIDRLIALGAADPEVEAARACSASGAGAGAERAAC